MTMFCQDVCLCIACVPDAQEGQKRVTDPLKLELEMAVNHHVGAATSVQEQQVF